MYREFEMKHKFFKNSTHFMFTAKKQLRESRIECELFSDENLFLLAWGLSQGSFFRRAGVNIPIDILMWKIKSNELTTELIDKYVKIMPELKSLYSGQTYIRKCKVMRKEFPLEGELNIFLTLSDKDDYSDEYLKLLEEHKADPGVYFLYDIDKKLIYIGKSYNLGARMSSSVQERKAFYCTCIKTKTEADANILEPYFIALRRPRLNRDIVPIDHPSFKIDVKYKGCDMVPVFRDSDDIIPPDKNIR